MSSILQKLGRYWTRRLPGAPRAETLSAFALTFVFLPFCDYVLPTALDGRLGQFRPAVSCACANFDPSRRSRLFRFAKIAKYRVPTCLIQTSSPNLFDCTVSCHQHSVRDPCEAKLDVGPVWRVGQRIGEGYAVFQAVVSGGFHCVATDPEYADSSLF
jgi:hypothetical protein